MEIRKKITFQFTLIVAVLMLVSFVVIYFFDIKLALVFVVNLLLMYFLGRFFASKALFPISKIIEQVNDIDINNINSRIKAGSGNDEIAQLADTFNKLLERVETTVVIQKDFITNSSHELRNPLTAITGQLEVTLMQERSTDEYKVALQSVLEDIKNLNQLANRLLILSRATNIFTSQSFDNVRIDDVLWDVRALLLKAHKNYLVDLFFDDSIKGEQHFIVHGNEQLLKTAFFNLIDNGCKYSPNHKAEITLSAIEDNLQIRVKDEGIGIPEEEITKIFEPFYRGSNVRKTRGHGIGMSLVNRIIELHQGKVSVQSVLKKGTEFIAELPLP